MTAAIVRYDLLGVPRTGVCTTHLADRLHVSSRALVFISRNDHFRLPEKPETPIIMIGPGTGLAPFRAFLQERVRSTSGENVLYFGCRRKAYDYLYASELDELAREGKVALHATIAAFPGAFVVYWTPPTVTVAHDGTTEASPIEKEVYGRRMTMEYRCTDW